MRKYTFLMAILCLLFLTACQKETIAPLPDTIDETQFLQLNTIEDLIEFEKMVEQEDAAISRGNLFGKVIHVQGGSKNAIQDAIQEAGRYGLVILDKGKHYEDGTILIEQPVYVLGRTGASIISSTKLVEEIGVVQPVFHIHQTTRVTIWGIEMQGKANGGGTGILVEGSNKIALSKNTITNFQMGIAIEQSDNALIWKNEITNTPRALIGEIQLSVGIVVVNGENARLIQNTVSNAIFGIFASDKDGVAQKNEVYGNLIGMILCNVQPIIPLASGVIGSEVPCKNWAVQDNHAHDNFDVGYLVIDGANNNTIINNRGGNNARVDMDLTGDTNRFGFFTPKSYSNFVDVRSYTNLTIKDCGEHNRIRGGVMIDTSERPCF